MKFYDHLPAILAGTMITSALVITIPNPASALTGQEVNDIARNITVLFQGTQGQHGSGFIIAKNGNTYSVLTAHHVVAREDDYKIVTADQQAHRIDYSKVKPLPGVDLAVVEFTSDKDYQVAKLGTAPTSEGQDVFVSGWPKLGSTGQQAGGTLTRQFTGGAISGYLPVAFRGYQMTYTNTTRGGMSGGPVLDAGGRVVGVHGMGDGEDIQTLLGQGLNQEAATTIASTFKTGFNYAIPISTYLQVAPQAGIYLSVQVENSPAPQLGATYVAGAPDSRDTISDINATLNTVNQGVGIIRNIFGF